MSVAGPVIQANERLTFEDDLIKVRRSAILHYTVNQCPHWACWQYGHTGGTRGWLDRRDTVSPLLQTNRFSLTEACYCSWLYSIWKIITLVTTLVINYSFDCSRITLFGMIREVVPTLRRFWDCFTWNSR